MIALLLALVLASPGEAIPTSPKDLAAYSGDGWVVLTWDSNDEGPTITEYVVYRSTHPSLEPWMSRSVSRSSTPFGYVASIPGTEILGGKQTRVFWDFALTNGETYRYWVQVVGNDGSTAYSASPSYVAVAPGLSRTAIGDVRTRSGNGFVEVQWAINTEEAGTGIYGYIVYRSTGRGPWSEVFWQDDAGATTYLDTSLTNDQLYQYMVFPCCPMRTPAYVTATPYLQARTSGTASGRTAGPLLVEVSWSAGTPGSYPIAKYAVFRSDNGGASFHIVGETASLVLRDPVPSYGKRYLYLIRPRDTMGNLGDAYPIVIVDVELPANRLFLNHNRFRPGSGEMLDVHFQITEPGRVRIAVFALTGERVVTLYDHEHLGSYTPDVPFNTVNEWTAPATKWNGANGSGSLVGSGAYFVILEINKSRSIHSVAVVR
jgi:hypothetical protein